MLCNLLLLTLPFKKKKIESKGIDNILQWLTDNGAIADEQLVELRGERSEKAAECCNEATQNRGESCTFSPTKRYCYRWN